LTIRKRIFLESARCSLIYELTKFTTHLPIIFPPILHHSMLSMDNASFSSHHLAVCRSKVDKRLMDFDDCRPSTLQDRSRQH